MHRNHKAPPYFVFRPPFLAERYTEAANAGRGRPGEPLAAGNLAGRPGDVGQTAQRAPVSWEGSRPDAFMTILPS